MALNNIILNIEDIVLLKQKPDEYLEKTALKITKTHDGTSMGTLRKTIKTFSRKYAKSPIKHIVSYNEKGTVVSHVQRLGGQDKEIPIPDKVYDNNHNLDHISNVGEETDNIYHFGENRGATYQEEYAGFEETDYPQLLQKNTEGEYSYRSITIVSPNGSYMTLIKNNKFNTENEQKYTELTTKMHKELQTLNGNLHKDYLLKYRELYYDEGLSFMEADKQAMQYAIQKNGTMHQYLKDNHYPEQYEQECNVKLRITGKP